MVMLSLKKTVDVAKRNSKPYTCKRGRSVASGTAVDEKID
jgi:hypothetical protein